MERKQKNLIEAIRAAADPQFLGVIRAKVQSVDENAYTIKVRNCSDEGEADAPVYKASLRASVISGDIGFIAVPEVGSIVALGFVHNSEQQAIVLACSKVAKVIITVKTNIELKIDGSASGKLIIDSSGVKLGGAAEAQVKGDTMKGWAQQVDDALNAIIQWGATGVAASGGDADIGGIAPLSGVTAPSFPAGALSEKHKVD